MKLEAVYDPREGFTIIELIVVIGIVGILVAILLPAMSFVRQRVSESTCENNLHQIGIGLHLYRDDNATHFPLKISMKASVGTPPVTELANDDWRLFENGLGGQNPAINSPMIPQASERPLYAYVKNAEAFRCPRDRGWSQWWGWPISPNAWTALGCSYSYNIGPSGDPRGLLHLGLPGKPESWVANPTHFVVMYEHSALRWYGGERFIPLWHRSKGYVKHQADQTRKPPGAASIQPILFADGHVQAPWLPPYLPSRLPDLDKITWQQSNE